MGKVRRMIVAYVPMEDTWYITNIILAEDLPEKLGTCRNNPSTPESRGALLDRPDSHSLISTFTSRALLASNTVLYLVQGRKL